jgi:hypothetical protein
MPNREHDPALIELVYCVQYTYNFWGCSYDAHAEGSLLIHEPIFLDDKVLCPIYFLERGKSFRRRSDE